MHYGHTHMAVITLNLKCGGGVWAQEAEPINGPRIGYKLEHSDELVKPFPIQNKMSNTFYQNNEVVEHPSV